MTRATIPPLDPKPGLLVGVGVTFVCNRGITYTGVIRGHFVDVGRFDVRTDGGARFFVHRDQLELLDDQPFKAAS